MEHLGPKQFFKFQVFFGDQEKGLIYSDIYFIKDCIRDHLVKDTLLIVPIALQEELMAGWVWYHVIKEYADLIPETFVIFFIALSEN